MYRLCRIEMPNEQVNAEIDEQGDVSDTMTHTENKHFGESRVHG